ncbi:GntP family permease, partial [Acinetobacter nosocomialis]|nr:GntP family permease [Acinetobacter nosocomialis]
PHPAALLAVQAYHADIGKTIMYSLLVGVPTAVVAGPLYALWINKYVKLPENNPLAKQFVEAETAQITSMVSGQVAQ